MPGSARVVDELVARLDAARLPPPLLAEVREANSRRRTPEYHARGSAEAHTGAWCDQRDLSWAGADSDFDWEPPSLISHLIVLAFNI